MDTTLVALYDDPLAARRACERLDGKGVDRSNVSLIANDINGDFSRATGMEAEPGRRPSTAVQETDVGMVPQPEAPWMGREADRMDLHGIGPARVGGQLAPVLTGNGGPACGNLFTCLTDLGVPDDDAHAFAEGVRRGGSLVVVRTAEDRADDIEATLASFHPVDLDERTAAWRAEGWSRFDHAGTPLTAAEIRAERTRRGWTPPGYPPVDRTREDLPH